MQSIEKILNQKKWTGEEVARVFIANALALYNSSLRGDPNPRGIIEPSEFKKMKKGLIKDADNHTYYGYMDIYGWVTDTLQMVQAQEQQAQLQLAFFEEVITNAITAEDLHQYIAELPVIMTQKQYDEYVAEKEEEILHPEGGIWDNVLQLILNGIGYYLERLDEKKNPLTPLKKKLEKEPVTDPFTLENYTKIMGEGYYTTASGERSDQMEVEEWQDLIAPQLRDILANEQLPEADRDLILSDIVQKKRLKRATLLYYGDLSEEEQKQKDHSDQVRDELIKKVQWHYYEDPPEDLTKWDILTSGQLLDFYDYSSEDITEEEQNEVCKRFYAEYKEVADAIIKDIKENYPQYKEVVSCKVEEWMDNYIEWEELAKSDLYGFRAEQLNENAFFSHQRGKGLLNGIAIVRPSELIGRCKRIDPQTGYYTPPSISPTLEALSLNGLFPESEGFADNLGRVERFRKYFTASLYFVRAYNVALELIMELYGIEELETIRRPEELFKEEIERINANIMGLYQRVCYTTYEDSELKEKKLEVLRDILYPLEWEATDTDPERIKTTKNNMKNFACFTAEEKNPINTLLAYHDEEGGRVL